uniref:Uncharacterized protein n=1 Tax=Physcomitrium patens TaxID=3218 RepID=A0A2K1JZR0_PHYPA|nr:hypothetical protein PHYPA_014137 [Physcomitrium patens]
MSKHSFDQFYSVIPVHRPRSVEGASAYYLELSIIKCHSGKQFLSRVIDRKWSLNKLTQ